MTKKDARETGRQIGYDIAMENAPEVSKDLSRLREPLSKADLIDAIVSVALETESEHYRQFSPFEELASAINRSRDPDAVWGAYEEGVSKGAEAAAKKFVRER